MPHKSIIFTNSLIGFLTGVFVHSFYVWPESVSLFVVVVGILMFVVIRHRVYKLLGIGLVFFALGGFYYVLRLPIETPKAIQYYNDEWSTFSGTISTEVDRRSDKQKIVLSTKTIKIDGTDKPVSGRVLVNADLYPEYEYGDELDISCRLVAPEPIEDFAYDKYLALTGVYSICYRPKIEITSQNEGSIVFSLIYKAKHSLINIVNRMMGEPHAAFLAGLLVGARRGIPDNLLEAFNRTGVTHIIAISGYNITIIASIVLGLTQKYIGRKRAFWLVLLALGFFAVITGAQASVIRATIMGIVVLLARQVGRLSNVGNVMVLAAWVMVLVNPLVLAYDAGFQLSFLATIGLVYLVPKMEKYFQWVPEHMSLRESLVCTLSATCLTLPLIVYQFGRLSLVAPIANIMILPFIPIIMAIGFGAAMLGFVWIGLGQVVIWMAWLLLSYVIIVVKLFSGLGFASIEIPQMPIAVLIVGYLFIFSLIKNPLSLIKRQRISGGR
ncbi:ComEC family competence protein [Patescibacteria group bacterium]|nr:ComEC family competence protein [Patescibacteria group bacterium]MBU1890376.1 ComEC family competence protein [Patescibacteria group bacterium]